MSQTVRTFLQSSVSSFLIRRFSSFTYLNFTQFLGALIDNIYKFLIVYFLIGLEGIENSYRIMSFTGATFVFPFLLFSSFSGTLADRLSKRNVIVSTKILELVIMLFGILAFYYQSKVGAYCLLFLLATQSAIFGPSKYGIIPELVSTDKISKSNGLMTSFTFLAIIFGTFLASFMLDYTNRNFILASIFCTFLSCVGLFTSFCIEYTPPAGSSKKFNVKFLNEIYATLKMARNAPSLLMAIVGSAFFMFLGAFVQLNIIPFAVESLHLTDIQGGYLFLLTALGIGSGCMIAGKISGKTVELGLVPIAGVCVVICCYLLDLFSDHLKVEIVLLILLGMFGGIYQIPLDSYIQVASPHNYRGQIIGATNFLSFFGVLCASFLVYATSEFFGFKADKGFTIMGSLTLGVITIITFQYFDYLTRFVGMILSRLHFNITFIGKENLSDSPAIYVCYHQAWNDTLILLGSQRRRMRFFAEQEQDHTKWMKKLYGLLKVVLIPTLEPLENNHECIDSIQQALKNGISVCIFVQKEDIENQITRLLNSYFFQQNTPFPIIPVVIQKGEKKKQPRFFKRLLHKFRVPAEICFGRPTREYPFEPSEQANYIL